MARREYKQRPEYKQIWPIYIGIPSKTSQNPQNQASKICLKSACIPSFSLATRPPRSPQGPIETPQGPLGALRRLQSLLRHFRGHYWIPGGALRALVPAPRSLLPGPWSLVPDPWSLVPGSWSLGPWSLLGFRNIVLP